jgi:hypothetical protein
VVRRQVHRLDYVQKVSSQQYSTYERALAPTWDSGRLRCNVGYISLFFRASLCRRTVFLKKLDSTVGLRRYSLEVDYSPTHPPPRLPTGMLRAVTGMSSLDLVYLHIYVHSTCSLHVFVHTVRYRSLGDRLRTYCMIQYCTHFL